MKKRAHDIVWRFSMRDEGRQGSTYVTRIRMDPYVKKGRTVAAAKPSEAMAVIAYSAVCQLAVDLSGDPGQFRLYYDKRALVEAFGRAMLSTQRGAS